MKSKTSSCLTYLAALAIGVLLLIFAKQTDLFRIMVIIIGILFVVPSAIAIIYSWIPAKDAEGRKTPKPWYLGALGIVGLTFGILLLCMPTFFAAYIVYTLGIVLILCGLFQIIHISQVSAIVKINKTFYLMPWITLICGIVIIIVGPKIVSDVVSILTGAFLVGYAVNGIVELVNEHKKAKAMDKALTSEKKDEESSTPKSFSYTDE